MTNIFIILFDRSGLPAKLKYAKPWVYGEVREAIQFYAENLLVFAEVRCPFRNYSFHVSLNHWVLKIQHLSEK